MKYCKNCVLPNTKPGLFFDESGVCSACISVKRKEKIDWEQRKRDLKEICETIKRKNRHDYDCIVPVSGGKDSTYQAWVMKKEYNLEYEKNKLKCAVILHRASTKLMQIELIDSIRKQLIAGKLNYKVSDMLKVLKYERELLRI